MVHTWLGCAVNYPGVLNMAVAVWAVPCCAVVCCSGLPDSSVVKGMVLRRDTEGTIKTVKDAKVAVFAQVRGGGGCARCWVVVQQGQRRHAV